MTGDQEVVIRMLKELEPGNYLLRVNEWGFDSFYKFLKSSYDEGNTQIGLGTINIIHDRQLDREAKLPLYELSKILL